MRKEPVIAGARSKTGRELGVMVIWQGKMQQHWSGKDWRGNTRGASLNSGGAENHMRSRSSAVTWPLWAGDQEAGNKCIPGPCIGYSGTGHDAERYFVISGTSQLVSTTCQLLEGEAGSQDLSLGAQMIRWRSHLDSFAETSDHSGMQADKQGLPATVSLALVERQQWGSCWD